MGQDPKGEMGLLKTVLPEPYAEIADTAFRVGEVSAMIRARGFVDRDGYGIGWTAGKVFRLNELLAEHCGWWPE